MFKVGEKWITGEQIKDIAELEKLEELFEGEHWEVFKNDVISRLKLGYQVTEEGYFTNMLNGKMTSTGVNAESFFISENILGECTDTYTTLMLTDMPDIISESNQDWINETIKRTNFHDILMECANKQSYLGWAAVKSRLVDNLVEYDIIPNEYIFIVPKSDNKNKIDYILYAYKLVSVDNKTTTLITEEHYIDKIVYINYIVENDTVKSILPMVNDGLNPERRYETYYSWEENTTGNFLISFLNNSKKDDLLGETDYNYTAITQQREFAIRGTQTAISMDKTLNPTLQVPENLFQKNPVTGKMEANVVGKAIPTAEGDKEVKYVEYDGKYSTIMDYQDVLRGNICRQLGISPIIFDLGNGANIPSGTALKKALFRTIAETKKKQTQMTTFIQQLIKNGYNLETGLDIGDVSVSWSDPIPLDMLEMAQIAQIRTGNQPTLSQNSAIMLLDGKTEEQANNEINKINIKDVGGVNANG